MNKEQHNAIVEILKPDMNHMLILGHAGTGKTHTAIKAIGELLDKNKKVAVICPTHQAKEQFMMKLSLDVLTKVTVTTVASFLKQYPQQTTFGEIFFTKGTSFGEGYDVVIVDEVSMVSEYEMQCLSRSSAKIVYLGDFSQLPPVMKKRGDYWMTIPQFELTQQHRNAGNILQLCTKARTQIVFPEHETTDIKIHQTRDVMVDKMLKLMKNSSKPYEHCFLAYRNRVVDEVRDIVHTSMYGDTPFDTGHYVRLDHPCSIGNNGSLIKIIGARYKRTYAYDEGIDSYECDAINEYTGVRGLVLLVEPSVQNRIKDKIKKLVYDSTDAFKMNDRDSLESYQEQIKYLRKTFIFSSSPFVQTVHKSQGKSIPYVYVDTHDIKSGSNRMKLLYVAYSRAMTELNTIKV